MIQRKELIVLTLTFDVILLIALFIFIIWFYIKIYRKVKKAINEVSLNNQLYHEVIINKYTEHLDKVDKEE